MARQLPQIFKTNKSGETYGSDSDFAFDIDEYLND